MYAEGNLNYSILDKTSPIPMYFQIKQMILEDINGGKLAVEDMIPAEYTLCEYCQVSRSTIRQALSELVAEGYLRRLKGKGTFVAKPKIQAAFFNKLQSFNDEMHMKGFTPSTEVRDFRVVTNMPDICKRLELQEQDDLIYLERLRFADTDPIVLLSTYLPYKPYAEILEQDMVNHSLYMLLEKLFNVKIAKVLRKIEAVNATRKEAEILRIANRDALCQTKTLAFTPEGIPIEYSIAKYRGDRNEFSIELYR